MTKFSNRLLALPSQMSFLFGLSGFFLGFVFLFRPMFVVEFYGMDGDMLGFNTTILFCILFVVMLVSRTAQYLLRHRIAFSWFTHSFWCVAELIVASFFMALYMTLVYAGLYSYFDVLGRCLFFNLIILIFPYVILTLSVLVAEKSEAKAEDGSLVRFTDSTQKLKLMVASTAVLYLEAEENYVHVWYLEGESVRDYMLRNTMKSMEPLMQKHGMIRCQRSFFVNPTHVKVLRKDKQGVVMAELDVPGASPIPVSPKYYDALEKML